MKYLNCFIALVLMYSPFARGEGKSPVERDTEGYAIASCLTEQKEAYLKDQGNGWASVIIQRGAGGLDPLKEVLKAVKTAISKTEMPHMVKDPRHSVSLPIMYCAEIVDHPIVRRAVLKAQKNLSKAYKAK